ncbi:MAG: glycosyltransferase family 4 protein [Cyanobacteriota bacterium]|jgi:glycosyltransferase involved in cell wall biosynthesis
MMDLPDFYNPIHYSIIKRSFFRFNFPGLDDVQVNYSQLHQDMFVLCVLAGKREGVYMDIGAHEPIFISNTFLLEQTFGWRGIGLEWDAAMVARHQQFRRNPCLLANALQVDYEACMHEASLPPVIDYLSLDIDPPSNSLKALKLLPHHHYRFRVITFEHDLSFGGTKERVASREFLQELGYQLLVGDVSWCNHIVEDWWIDPNHTDPEIVKRLTPADSTVLHRHDVYFYTAPNPASGKQANAIGEVYPSWRTGEGICVEGWRDLNHSYSLVNQWQLLELLRHPIKLRHRDVKPFNPGWNAKDNASGLPEDLLLRLQQIPAPNTNDYFSLIYRIAFPLNLLDGPAERIFVFGTTELGYCLPNTFSGCSVAEARQRGNLTIVTASQWSKAGFLTEGFEEDEVVVLPHGVPTEHMQQIDPELRFFYRQVFGFQPDDFVLLNLGALTSNKGIDLLLRAYANLKPSQPRLKLVIKDQSNLYGRRLQDVVNEMAASGRPLAMSEDHWNDVIPLSENLDLAGLRALYNACDAYVSPYRAEGFNLPPLEAAACGLPILVTAGGSTDDYFDPRLGLQIASALRQQGPGQYLEPDLEALQEAIVSILQAPQRWGGAIASQFVHAQFGWEVVGQRLWSLLSRT